MVEHQLQQSLHRAKVHDRNHGPSYMAKSNLQCRLNLHLQKALLLHLAKEKVNHIKERDQKK